MKLVLSIATLAIGLQFGAAAGFNFTFDSDVQGWTRGNFGNTFATIDVDSHGSAVFASNSGNGYILGSDHTTYAYHFSGDLGGNHGGLFGQQLTLDYRSAATGADDPFIVLMSSTAFLVLERTIAASAGFNSYSFALDASEGWYYNSSQYHQGSGAVLATNADIQSVLIDLRHVGVSTDIAGGGDTTWTDNVAAVPEPTTLAVMGLGALFLRRRPKN